MLLPRAHICFIVKWAVSVVDAYQEWSGPTKALQSALKKLKIDIGSDPILRYFVVSQFVIEHLGWSLFESWSGNWNSIQHFLWIIIDIFRLG